MPNAVTDIRLINTAKERLRPSDFVGKYNVYVVIRRGLMTFLGENNCYTARMYDLVVFLVPCIVSNFEYSDDFEADFLVLSQTFSNMYPYAEWLARGTVYFRQCPVTHLDSEGRDLIDTDFGMFVDRTRRAKTPFLQEIIGSVMRIFFFDLWTICEPYIAQMKSSDHPSRLFMQFTAMLEKQIRREREINYYADQLCITPKYLSQVCNRLSGLSASQWILRYATIELIALLNDPKKTLTDVANEMNFKSQSFFSRYVKKVTGMPPTDFRKKTTKRID